MLAIGPGLLVGIAAIVAIAVVASYGISRGLGLPVRMAILVACGNSICGNSAIAAVAAVIGANEDEVASSIAFTAVLGVVVVLTLPLLSPLLGLSVTQYGVLAGLTVYAVPQVLAATLPIGALANQVGTVVKLVRVLMLGPVVLALALVTRRLRDQTDEGTPQVSTGEQPRRRSPALHQLVPLSFSEGDCTSSLGWPPCVHRTSDRERSEVLCTKRRERSELLRTLVHGATKPEPPKIPAINRQAA